MNAISFANTIKTAERETKTNLTVESTLREIFKIRFYLTLYITGIFKDNTTALLELSIEKDAQGINSAIITDTVSKNFLGEKIDNLDSSREKNVSEIDE
jgi:hypothetical protein